VRNLGVENSCSYREYFTYRFEKGTKNMNDCHAPR
jgi:hypothetical protein